MIGRVGEGATGDRVGDGFYVGGLLSAETARADIDRTSTDGTGILRLTGASNATRYSGTLEAGYAAGIGRGLTLTPRAQLGYGRYTLDGFSEQGGETALKLDDLTIARLEARPIATMSLEAQEKHERIERVSRDD